MEAELPTMEGRAAKMRSELVKIVAEIEAAGADRRALLIERNAEDTLELRKADDRCRKAEDRRAAYEDALRELVDRIEATREAIAGISDRKERERLADRLEARAIEIESAAAILDDRAREFGKARLALLDVLEKSGYSDGGTGRFGFRVGDEQAGVLLQPIVAAAIRLVAPDALPDSLPLYGMQGAPVSAAAAAAALQVKPLRFQASGIRAGELAAVEPPAPAPTGLHVDIEETGVVFRESVCFNGADNRVVHLTEGGARVPVPVAEAAIEKGLAFSPTSTEGAAILRELAKGQGTRFGLGKPDDTIVRRGPPWTDLRVSIYDYVARLKDGDLPMAAQ